LRDAAFHEPLIEATGIVKKFGSLVANDVERFELRSGEVHALLGENGAGKSTLCKILYGYYRADKGQVLIRGEKVSIASPRDARALGIGMVFQTFTLIPAFSVLENILLFLPDLPFAISRKESIRRIEEIAAHYRFTVKLDVLAGRLSAGEQQQVEILKQLLAGARVLILDEPTKVLTPQESAGLFESMAALKASGIGIVFITHKLAEVLSCADRITVMRHGRVAGQLDGEKANEAALLALMFDVLPSLAQPRRAPRLGPAAVPAQVELKDVSASGAGGSLPLTGLNLKLSSGEIVGVAGISGNGQRELSDLILGLTGPSGGTKLMWGQDAASWSVATVREKGTASIADDPHVLSTVASLTVRENLALGTGGTYRARFGIHWDALDQAMTAVFSRFGLPRPPFETKAGNLSGGNLQRVVIARELSRDPRLIVALYPTRGLDVQSAAAVRGALLTMRDRGAAILVFSEELDELFFLSDRILVLNGGTLVREFSPEEYDAETIGRYMVRMPELSNAA
jgi:general nucleoside transport system ATP-binding protein